jgi:riboflavin kinase/FMN adenylyltransferase
MQVEISGIVIHGDGYGKKIGFPTVNLKTKTEARLPFSGVYAGSGELGGKNYRAGIVIGPHDKIEAHLIGFSGDAYGKKVVLRLEKFLRPYKNFSSEQELIEQIKKDIEQC